MVDRSPAVIYAPAAAVMPGWVLARVERRRGRRLVHEDVPAAATALVVVDLQRYFMAPGAAGEVAAAREIVGPVNRLSHALRRAGGRIVWLTTAADPASRTAWSTFHTVLSTPTQDRARVDGLGPGAPEAGLWPGLEPEAGDLHVVKRRFSPFTPGSSDLDAVLRSHGVEAVLIAGTMTNVCCDATARDAMLMNYRATMVSDANATVTVEEHVAALSNFYLAFGDVTDTAALCRRYGDAAG